MYFLVTLYTLKNAGTVEQKLAEVVRIKYGSHDGSKKQKNSEKELEALLGKL